MNKSLMFIDTVKNQPDFINDPSAISSVLRAAGSYLEHAGDLIYSYGSRTFLSGYDLFDKDHDGKGNIDCSTFVLLVLAGIPYELSPYGTGSTKEIKPRPFVDMDFSCFENIPERYISIAERIGRPELMCEKGIDLEKAEALGISREQIHLEIKATANPRRSAALARHFLEKGECFTDPGSRMPGDIVFYQSKSFFLGGIQIEDNESLVTHVGIVSADPHKMINSSGYVSKERAEEEQLPAVSLSGIFGKRKPLFWARPHYQIPDNRYAVGKI